MAAKVGRRRAGGAAGVLRVVTPLHAVPRNSSVHQNPRGTTAVSLGVSADFGRALRLVSDAKRSTVGLVGAGAGAGPGQGSGSALSVHFSVNFKMLNKKVYKFYIQMETGERCASQDAPPHWRGYQARGAEGLGSTCPKGPQPSSQHWVTGGISLGLWARRRWICPSFVSVSLHLPLFSSLSPTPPSVSLTPPPVPSPPLPPHLWAGCPEKLINCSSPLAGGSNSSVAS